MRKITRLLLLWVSVFLISCSTTSYHIPGVYRLDIQQGNIIDQDMIDQLRPNMTKRQVLYILGSPMLIDVFHQKRWDYIYSEQPGGETRKQQRISLNFEDDILVGVQGDYRPSTLPVARANTDTTVDVPKREGKKTVFGEIIKFFSFAEDEASPNKQKDSSEETKTEKQTEPEQSEQESAPEGIKVQLPAKTETVQDIKTETTDDTALESTPELERAISDNNSSETSASEPISPEQQIDEQQKTTAEQIEDKAAEDAEKQEEAFSKQFEELSKPPVIQIPE